MVNLGNVVGLIKSTSAPSKLYVLWAHVVDNAYPNEFILKKYNGLTASWEPIDASNSHWLSPVLSYNQTTPPPTPAVGDSYLLSDTGLTGAWAGHTNQHATWLGNNWSYTTAKRGAEVKNFTTPETSYIFNGTVWVIAASGVYTAGTGLQLIGNEFSVDTAYLNANYFPIDNSVDLDVAFNGTAGLRFNDLTYIEFNGTDQGDALFDAFQSVTYSGTDQGDFYVGGYNSVGFVGNGTDGFNVADYNYYLVDVNGVGGYVRYTVGTTFTVEGTPGAFAGIQYDIDFSAQYTNRSLVDKGFVVNNTWLKGGQSLGFTPSVIGSLDGTDWGLTRGSIEYATLTNVGLRLQNAFGQPDTGVLYYKNTVGRVVMGPDNGSTSGGIIFNVWGMTGGSTLGVPQYDNSFSVAQYNGSFVYNALFLANGGNILIGTNTSSLPSARFDIRTFSSSSGNKAWRIENSSSAEIAVIKENGDATFATTNFTGYVTLNGDPVNTLHAASKNYVDNLVNGLDWKASARVATTANITLSGTQTIDTIALSVGNRVLVKDQSTASENGIYLVSAGAWTRTTDADTSNELDEATIGIEEGTTNANTQWHCTTTAPITIGVTAITFVTIGSAVYAAGSGLQLLGNVFSVATNGITDAMVSAHTSTKVTITNKVQLNTAIAYNDQSNTFANLTNQIFYGGSVKIYNAAATFTYSITSSAILADRQINLPVLTGNDVFVFEAHTQTLTNKTIVAVNNTITDTSAALGDLFKHNGTRFVRMALGTSRQFLRVNTAGTDLEYDTFSYTEAVTALSTPGAASTWTVTTVTGAPANSLVEISCSVSTNATRTLGVRAVGSGLTRTIGVTGSGATCNVLVRTNASSQVELFASVVANSVFTYFGTLD